MMNKVGLYIRLSREDNDKIWESESITNQKSLLMQYVKENNLNVYDIYVDDGYSGTNFDRPGFKKMIKDIENKKINMIITKDMSRLGRDYIGTGELVEKYFPKHNIRYIAITDNIDTFLDNSNNDIAPFKAIMNDFYAKDISKKIKASLRAKMREGKFVGARAPFGYQKDLNNKNHLVIRKEQADVVKRIFKLSLKGLSYFKIARILTKDRIKTPAQYYDFKWKNSDNIEYGNWHAKTIQDILKNRIYTGDLVQNRRNKVNYKVKKIINNNSNEFIIVSNTHEPIIDKETFDEVQKRLPKNIGRIEKKEFHLLDGLLFCGDCGHRISVTSRRKKDNRCYTVCNYYRTSLNDKKCTMHSNNYDELEKVILDLLKQICTKNVDFKIIKRIVFDNLNLQKENDISCKIKNIKNDLNKLIEKLDNVYIDKLNNVITLSQFERIKNIINKDIEIKKKEYNNLISKKNNFNNLTKHDEIIEKYYNDFWNVKYLTRELIINLIDKIEIFADKTINIKVNFS